MEQFLIVKQLMSLYCFNTYKYSYMYPTESGGSYATTSTPLDESVMFEHLNGVRTVAVYARDRNTIFHCYDVDEANPEHVHLLIDKLVSEGIPREKIYVSTSGNKGYHVEYFFDQPVWKSLIENFYNYIRRDPEIAEIKMECRPIRNTTIKIPLGINFKTGRRCWYVDPDTLEPIEDMDYVFQIQRISAEDFGAIVLRCNKQAKVEDIAKAKVTAASASSRRRKPRRKVFKSETAPVMTESGQRHELMRKRAVWLRVVGGDEDEIYDDLIRWVERQDPELIGSSMDEIERDARELAASAVRKYDVVVPEKQIMTVRRKPEITARDMRVILAAPTKNARRVAMLICAFCKVYGKCCLGFERIAQIVGVTYKTAYNAVNTLIEYGIVEKKKTGGVVYVHGNPVLQPNEYAMVTDIGIMGEYDVFGSMPVQIDRVRDDFDHFYYGAIAKMCSDDTIRKCLVRSERSIVEYERTKA